MGSYTCAAANQQCRWYTSRGYTLPRRCAHEDISSCCTMAWYIRENCASIHFHEAIYIALALVNRIGATNTMFFDKWAGLSTWLSVRLLIHRVRSDSLL